MIGRTISHYRILERLGEGGMGVVYRALDTHLERPVAIKVLRPEALRDPERKKRFVLEAKAASALNHPNILTIHDIDTADGVGFIVMEYVAGRTLDSVIGRRGLPFSEALRYSVQIADALAAAHAAGIVHRDLKPANVMVTEKGHVKVLDFGLAKLSEREESDDLTLTRTLQSDAAPHTEEGTILGTVAYMSPEQAEGKRVDSRSDIFSFGAVLYEMITAHRPFQGETKLSTLTAILHKEPKPVAQIVEGAPHELERILSRCMRKDPARRFQQIEEVKLALEDLKEESESGKLASPTASAGRPSWPYALAVLLALALGAGMMWWLTRPRPRPAPTLTRLTYDSGLTFEPALSPDGKLLAYASDRSGDGNLDIWVQQIGSGQPIRLTRHPADDHEPAFSPDGRAIAFRSERDGGGIYTVPALGGDERLIAERGSRPRFSPAGNEIAYYVGDLTFYSQIHVAPASGGQPRRIQSDFGVASAPIWSPDGKRLLFLGGRTGGASADWWVASIGGGEAIPTHARAMLTKARLTLTAPELWLPDDHGVLFSSRSGDATNIWKIRISAESGKILGMPERVTHGAGLEANPAMAGGRVTFASLNSQVDVWSLPVDANAGKVTGAPAKLTDDVAVDTRPAISADGRKLVFLSNRSGNLDVWLKDLATGKETALTATPISESRVRMSADGSTVFYNQGQSPIFASSLQGGVPRNICNDCGILLAMAPDASSLIYWPGGTPIRLFSLEVRSGLRTEILPSKEMGRYRPLFSPDGRWLTFTAGPETIRSKIMVAPFRPGETIGEAEWIVAADVPPWTNQPDWSPNGAVLYFLARQDGFPCIWAQRLDAAAKRPAGAPFELHHFGSARRSFNNLPESDISLSVARDKLVFSMGERTGNIWMLDGAGR